MKQLFIIRHAKSDWDNPRLDDFDRPLNARGQRNAPDMADRLLKKHRIPQLILSSPAVRAHSTARHFAQVLGITPDRIRLEPRIYEATLATLLQIVNNLDDAFDQVALVGHNPGLSYLAEFLLGQATGNIPTCGIVVCSFPFDSWTALSQDTGELLLYDYPKNVPD